MKEQTVKKGLLSARKSILETKVVKEGKNTFSKYDYFTPSQITTLVTKACIENELITTFSIIKELDSYKGVLKVECLNSDSFLEFTIPTAMPDIKATNITQKLGGMVTYTQRYLEMLAFGITDNNLELDVQNNKKEKVETQKKSLDVNTFNSVLEAVEKGTYTKQKIKNAYALTTEQINQLNKL